MQNTLLEAALSFHSLCEAELHIEFNNEEKIDLIFKKDQFYHLAGLHKLRDHWVGSTRNKASIMKRILLEEIKTEDLASSRYYDNGMDNVQDRISCMPKIAEMIVDGKMAVWNFDCNKGLFQSKIKANILFFEVGQYNMVLVLACVQKDKHKRYYPESFFVRTDRKYIDGQTKTRIIAVTEIPIL